MREDQILIPADASPASPVHRFAIGAVVCDLADGQILGDGRDERLEPRLCGVLSLLVQYAPEPVTRDMFLEIVWDGDGSDEALTQSISRLRRLLGDAGAIRTHPRIGYSLTRPVQPAPLALPGMEPKPASGWRTHLGRRQWAAVGAAAVMLAVLAGVWIERVRTTPAPGEVEFIEIEREFDTAPGS